MSKGSYKIALVYLSICLSIYIKISVTALTIFLIFSEMKENNISRTITEPNSWKTIFPGLQGSKRGISCEIVYGPLPLSYLLEIWSKNFFYIKYLVRGQWVLTIGLKDFSQKKCLDPFFRGHLDIRKLLPMDLFDPGLYEMSEGFLIMRVQYDNNYY